MHCTNPQEAIFVPKEKALLVQSLMYFIMLNLMAEGEGFEPPVPFQAQRFSRPPVSTAHPSLRSWERP